MLHTVVRGFESLSVHKADSAYLLNKVSGGGWRPASVGGLVKPLRWAVKVCTLSAFLVPVAEWLKPAAATRTFVGSIPTRYSRERVFA